MIVFASIVCWKKLRGGMQLMSNYLAPKIPIIIMTASSQEKTKKIVDGQRDDGDQARHLPVENGGYLDSVTGDKCVFCSIM